MRIERLFRRLLQEMMFANDMALRARHGDGNFTTLAKRLIAERTPTPEEAADDAMVLAQEQETLRRMNERRIYEEQELAALQGAQNVNVTRAADAPMPAQPTTGTTDLGRPEPHPDALQKEQPENEPKADAVGDTKTEDTKTTAGAPPPRPSRSK